MTYKVVVTEKLKTVVEVKAKSVTDALRKVEKKYYNDKVEAGSLSGVEFVADLGDSKFVKEGVEDES